MRKREALEHGEVREHRRGDGGGHASWFVILLPLMLIACGATTSNSAPAQTTAAPAAAPPLWPARAEVTLTPVTDTTISIRVEAWRRRLCDAPNMEAARARQPLPESSACAEVPADAAVVVVNAPQNGPRLALGSTAADGHVEYQTAATTASVFGTGSVVLVDGIPVHANTESAFNTLIAALAHRRVQAMPPPSAVATAAPPQVQPDAEEIRTLRCSPAHSAEMQRALQSLQQVLASDGLTLAWHQIAVAAPNSPSFPYTESFAGEWHFVVMAYLPIALDFADDGGNALVIPSPYEGLVRSGRWETATRVYQANANDTHTVHVRGGGCVLLTSWYR